MTVMNMTLVQIVLFVPELYAATIESISIDERITE